jgi:hypothetical protein
MDGWMDAAAVAVGRSVSARAATTRTMWDLGSGFCCRWRSSCLRRGRSCANWCPPGSSKTWPPPRRPRSPPPSVRSSQTPLRESALAPRWRWQGPGSEPAPWLPCPIVEEGLPAAREKPVAPLICSTRPPASPASHAIPGAAALYAPAFCAERPSALHSSQESSPLSSPAAAANVSGPCLAAVAPPDAANNKRGVAKRGYLYHENIENLSLGTTHVAFHW